MAEYDIAFGEKLAEVAALLVAQGMHDIATMRTVLYLSLLSAEISLKAMLEQAGKPVVEIRAHSHRLIDLLTDVCQCEVEVDEPGVHRYVPATRLRGVPLKPGSQTTVGEVIGHAKRQKGKAVSDKRMSSYPGQIRYGGVIRHFPAAVNAQMAVEVAAFAREHWNSIRIRQETAETLNA